MDLHLLPLSATDVESDSDYLATPVDTPYPSAPYPHILQANQHPFSSPGAYRSPPPPSSATCDAPATRGAPHLDFGREVFDPATFGQNQPYVLDRYSSSDLAQHPPSDWIDHGVSDFPKVEITPWITRPKFQPADLPLQHAHEYTPDSCFEAEATYDDAREVAAAAGRMSYDLEHRVSDLPPSQHLHEYGFRQCDGHVSSSSPPVFSPLADYAADDLPHERIHQPSAYFDTHRAFTGITASRRSGSAHGLEGPTVPIAAHNTSLYYESSPGHHDYERLASSPDEYLPFSDQGLSTASTSPSAPHTWTANLYEHSSAQAAAQAASHQAAYRRNFVINMHRPPSCPYVYPRFDELPSSFSLPPSIRTQHLQSERLRAWDSSGYHAEDEDDFTHPAYRVLSIPTAATPIMPPRQPALIEDSPKKPLTLACFFCRKRKIACGSPPAGKRDRTCNQCARRNLKCVYPHASRRGMRPKNAYEDDTGVLSIPTLPTLP